MINAGFTFIDAYSRTSTKKAEGTTAVMSEAETEADALLASWMAVTKMGCTKTTFSQERLEDDAFEVGANVDAGGTLHVRLDNGKQAVIKIPAIDEDLVNPDGSIDIEAAAITGLVAHYESGGNYRLSEGNHVVALLYGELDR